MPRSSILPPSGETRFRMDFKVVDFPAVIPKRARELFGLNRGDTLVVLGDTNPGTAGIALVPAQFLTGHGTG